MYLFSLIARFNTIGFGKVSTDYLYNITNKIPDICSNTIYIIKRSFLHPSVHPGDTTFKYEKKTE